jgi:hypothetical protein
VQEGSTPDASGQDARVEGSSDAGAESTTSIEGGSDGGAGVAFCDATYGALRVAFEGCCTSGDTTTDQYKFIDAIYVALTQTCEKQLASAIGGGRVTFDPTAAAACEQAFQQTVAAGVCWGNIDTNQPGPPQYALPACAGVVTGLQTAGSPCAVDFECKDGLACVGWTGAGDGHCALPGDAGASCEQSPDASSALDIDYGFGTHPSCTPGAYCVTPTCKAQAAPGAACSSDQACQGGGDCHLGKCGDAGPTSDGGGCDTRADCQQGLYCAPGDGGALPGSCQSRLPAGGQCTATGDECKGICVVPDGGKTGICTAVCGSG